MIFIELFCMSFLVACYSVTQMITFIKWGIFDWIELHIMKRVICIRVAKSKFLTFRTPREICIFCVGFWFCVEGLFIAWCACDFNLSLWHLSIPFTAASLTRVFYEAAGIKRR